MNVYQLQRSLGRKNVVEADKAFIGGKDKQGHDDKSVVLGLVERGGMVLTRVVPNRSMFAVMPHILTHVLPGSRVATDTATAFNPLIEEGYAHGTVNHSAGEYVRGPVHTNTIENFWAILKRSIRGTHIHVSKKYLPLYLGEFEYRYNMHRVPNLMFDRLLRSF